MLFGGLWRNIVRKVKNSRGFVATAGQTNEFLQFKVELIWFSMFLHYGSFSIGPCRPLPYAKLSSINLEIGTCHVNLWA